MKFELICVQLLALNSWLFWSIRQDGETLHIKELLLATTRFGHHCELAVVFQGFPKFETRQRYICLLCRRSPTRL